MDHPGSTINQNGLHGIQKMQQYSQLPYMTLSGHETNTSGLDPSTTSTVNTTSEQGIHKDIDIDRFGSYHKLLRVTAYVMRFIQNSRSS
jgi:hypothetical protein